MALVQHNSIDAGTTTSASLAFTSNNTSGNWIAVCIRAENPGEAFAVSDSKGNAYRSAIQYSEIENGNILGIFYAENIAAGANTVTVSDSVSANLSFAIFEYSGLATSGSLDAIVGTQGSSASPNSASVTTRANGDLLLGAILTANTATFTMGSGYALEESVPAEPYTELIVEDQIQANAGAASATASITSSDFGDWAAVLVAFSPVPEPPPIAFVQVNGTAPQTPQTTVSLPYTLAQTAGDLNVVVVGWNDSTTTVSSVADSKGNGYSLAVGPTVQTNSGTQAIYYAKNIASAAANSNNVTVTFSTAANYPDIRIAEYSGVDTVNPVDVSAAAQGMSSTSDSGTVTTTNANDLLVGANLVKGYTTSPGVGYTSRLKTDPDGDILEDRVVTTAGTYSATAPVGGSNAWIMQIVAFQPASSGGATPSITRLNPTSGTAGTSVTVTGTNFGTTQGTSTLKFNGTSATPASWSATSIVAPVPNGATTGNVVVTVGGVASNGVNFTVDVNQPPVVSAGTDQTITYPTNTATLLGTVTDDGLPVGSTLQISWSKVTGPGSVTFTNSSQASTQATFSLPGIYVLRLSANDGQYTSSADTRVIYAAPVGGGISVSAGPDQVIVFPSAATLAGSASDSNPPPGSTLSVAWSMFTGPGTATFASPSSLATTVTFSAPGVYDLRLTATNGTFTVSSDVKIYAGNVQCTLSNKGTDFWLMFTGAEYQNPATPNGQPPQQLYLFISSDVATSVTVTAGPSTSYLFNQTYSTIPGQITPVLIPQSVQMISSDAVDANGNATDAKGIHVTSQNPVAVYGLNFYPYASDGYLALPTVTLGTSYVIASYQNTLAANFPTFGTEFGITATQDNTDVTIVPTATSGTRQAQASFTIHLKQGQTYQLRNATDHTQFGVPNGPPVDFTGTLVTSTKPVAVFGGHDCTVIPDGSQYCNSLVEQLPPVNLWGQNFVTMPLGQELHGDTFRFVANTKDTHVQVNHQEVAVLQQGQFYEQIISGPAEITADNPILTVQYALSNLAGGGSNVDPTMIVVPPFEQFGGSYTINTPTSGWFPANFVNIIAPTSAAQASGVLLDGAPVPAVAFQPIGTSPFSGAQINVTLGAHTLTSSLPFGLWVYGFKLTDAYGYTGGVCFSTAVSGSTLVASPKTSTNQITSQLSVQATVKDSSGNPISGTGVTFTVAGVNSQSGYSVTNLSGVATFTYTSFKTGSDVTTITAGAASDTASITWISNGPNQPPVVSAGPNQTISLPTNSVTLNGSVADDGLPNPPGSFTSSWSKVSGPGTVSFTTPSQPQTSATFSQAGIYVLQLTGNDSALSASSSVTVTVLPPNQPPVVSAGSNQSFMWFQSQQIFFTGTAVDDGLPNPPGALTYNWSTVSGPDLVVFTNPTAKTGYATFNTPGNYVVQLSANDSQFTTTAYAVVNAYGPVSVNVGPSLQTTVGTPITINGSVLVGGQPPTGAMPLKLSWIINSEPNGSSVTFGSPSSAVTTASFNTLGTYRLCLQASDANLQPIVTTENCTLQVNVVATNPPVPTVAIATPLDGIQLTAPATVTGSVSSGTWVLDYALQDDSHSMNFTTLATGASVVSDAPLGTFDPTILLNGAYVMRLTSTNAAGQFATTSISVSVARNMKVGVFSLSFNDLTVPVSGIPIQVIRSYDSRDKGLGDFGIGWRLSLSNIRVQKSRSLSPNWQETQDFSGFLPQYCLFGTDNKTITVTFPDGRVFTFRTGGNPTCQQIGQIVAGTMTFTQQLGPANTAGATLTAADGGQFLVDGDAPGAVSLLGFDGNPYNPTTFILQTADGTKFTIDQKLGLTAVTDTNGNALTITPNGITSSAGNSVPFARDEQGRITRITDLDGKNLFYTYNSTGDLSGYTDRAANPTAYAYDNSHDLTGITTADGKQALTNTFDTSGRLSATKDGNGFTVSFTHNVPGQTETVTDRNGNPTTYLYDTDGNVTKVTDALNNFTTSTYDASDNKLSETNAKGKTSNYTYDLNGNRLTETDPLQHTTIYTYSAINKPLTITDANAHTTTNTYDTNGNLLTTTDPNGKVTTNTYSNSGLLLTTKDPNGKITSFTYDGTGNLLTQMDATGTVTSYVYDGNGNRTSQSVKRTLPGGAQQTLITTYAYDGDGHLLKTTNPDNSTTQTVYNGLGQQATTIDALGRQTTHVYDADGHVALTTYPDGTTESTFYDRNGNRTQFTDRTNIQTFYTYDLLNRLTQSQRGSSVISATITSSTYDAIGEVLTSTDANRNVTTYAYDDAGRRFTVTDALSHVTTFGYDAAGNQTSVKDANNNTTTYTYDNANRRTQVTYPDTKFETTTSDALGRVTARMDANGKTTQYGYDTIGRLTTVTDALSQITSYSYDEVGNRLTQTDANTHTTSYNYDQRGRRTQRKLPLGQSESYTYDAAGNLLTRTDFNGKITSYTYDTANRLLSKTPDPSFNAAAVTYTYLATGQRQSMTDASGTTIYGNYDNNGHVTDISTLGGRLFYSYDPAGNMTLLAAGSNVNYTYDALNRLSTVTAHDRQGNPLVSTYTYDNVGNLASVTYPNGVVHSYTYDTRNRLTNLGVNGTVSGAPGPVASYAYTLDAAGHRTGVTELSGRTVTYGYDNLYRLTGETIASDPNGIDGAVSYIYDPVGNRKQMTSTLAPVPGGLWNYDANDRFTAGDTYDNNGNTASSGGIANVYDFENRLIQQGGVSIVYDGNGNRVSKTVAGVRTIYWVAEQNPTGYAQVVEEEAGNGAGLEGYVYGLEQIARLQVFGTPPTVYYVHDGHGSVRGLTNTSGTVTDTYDYDAFGNLIHSTGTTPNNYLFAGEQFDPDLHLYYNRARYLNASTGRFWTMDAFEGDPQSPSALHKYAYTWNDPINHLDRSGHGIEDVTLAAYVYVTTQLGAVLNVVTIVAQTTALVLVAADAAGFLTSDRSLVSTYIATGGNPAAEIGTIYGEIRTLRTALALSRVESVFAQASGAFSEGETAIINEARQILGSSELAQIKEAFHAGREIQVVINGRTVGYQPGLPFSGMTWFEQRGFTFGDQAFSSDAELEKTVFHELYRLSPLSAQHFLGCRRRVCGASDSSSLSVCAKGQWTKVTKGERSGC